jgi:hypothetical protein
VAVSPAGRALLVTPPDSPGTGSVVWEVDLETGDRSVLSSSDNTADCTGLDTPHDCCTGFGTSTGEAPCAVVGSGSPIPVADTRQLLATVPSGLVQTVASMRVWGGVALASVLLGLAVRAMREREHVQSP